MFHRRSYHILPLVAFCSMIEACDINSTILDMHARALVSQIGSGTAIKQENIKKELDFIIPSSKQLSWEKSAFYQLIIDIQPTTRSARKKFGHNRLGTFVDQSRKAFDGADTTSLEQYAIFILCQSVIEKITDIMEIDETDIDEECIIPDQQLSFFINTANSTPHLSDDESQASSLSTQTSETINGKRSIIELNSRRSLQNYAQQIEKAEYPVRISCNLQCIKKTQIDTLKLAINDISERFNLREVIFMNGSSTKFNALFPFLEAFINKRKNDSKPIIVVFSTTSDSQQAYKRLYTLGEARPISKGAILETGKEKVREESVMDHKIIETDFSESDHRDLLNYLIKGKEG